MCRITQNVEDQVVVVHIPELLRELILSPNVNHEVSSHKQHNVEHDESRDLAPRAVHFLEGSMFGAAEGALESHIRQVEVKLFVLVLWTVK